MASKSENIKNLITKSPQKKSDSTEDDDLVEISDSKLNTVVSNKRSHVKASKKILSDDEDKENQFRNLSGTSVLKKTKKLVKTIQKKDSSNAEKDSDQTDDGQVDKKKNQSSKKTDLPSRKLRERKTQKKVQNDEDEDETETEDAVSDFEDSSSSKKRPIKKSQKTEKPFKKAKSTRKKEYTDHQENSDDFEIDRPKRKIKESAKKDNWLDDESQPETASSCDLESDREEHDTMIVRINDTDVLNLLNNEPETAIQSIINITNRNLEKLLGLRPFSNINDMNEKLRRNHLGYVQTSLKEILYARLVVNNLLEKCKQISSNIKKYVKRINDVSVAQDVTELKKLKLTKQPTVLNTNMSLKPYQIVGMNWLCFMYEEKLNAVLSDEMGLGKTCQTIALLAYIYEKNPRLLHLIVVPASTLENWSRELSQWFPDFNFHVYMGSPDERLAQRKEILKGLNNKKSRNPLNAILTTYSYVSFNKHDQAFFRSIGFEYVVYDEAHVLKNMKSLKYENLMKIKSKRKLLLTGTPLQNNIVELMSLLYFVTPDIFKNKTKYINKLFLPKPNQKDTDEFYNQKVTQAKAIMEPFIFRRLKIDVLKDLPEKNQETVFCEMTPYQKTEYNRRLDFFKTRKIENLAIKENGSGKENSKKEDCIFGVWTELRKAANHPLLLRTIYNDEKLKEMAALIMKESDADTRFDYVVEDMSLMHDFELHKMCSLYKGLKGYELSNQHILDSGKFKVLRNMLDEFNEAGDRVLLFSQFKIMLDIVEDFLKIIGHKFLRLDGSTKVTDRQSLIDKFNNDKTILVFMLTTKAGGVGINLTGANRVISHDIDYNPQNDRQAEDRCHRVGQDKQVQVYKLISKSSIDETMLKIQATKLELGADISGEHAGSKTRLDIMKMMKDVLN